MASYRVIMTHSAEKELGELERAVIPMLWDKIKKLAEEPRPRQSKRLKGMEKAYRLRFRDYRVIYNVDDDQKLVTVLAVRHRKEAYR